MKKTLSSSLAVVGALLAVITSGQAANFSVVVVPGLRFSPTNITVSVGDTITWTGLGNFHTVTPNNGVSEPFCGNTVQASCVSTFMTPGSFAYHCNPHFNSGMTGTVHVVAAPSLPPVVSITNPPHNILLVAPASVAVGVSASDPDGTVVSVRLLTNGVAAVTNTNPPFALTINNLAAGHYALRALAVDNQALSATSAPVNIRVVDRPVLSFGPGSNGPVQLQFNTITGVNYVVESASLLTNVSTFSGLTTNPGNGAGLQFAETNGGPAQRFYRVRVQ